MVAFVTGAHKTGTSSLVGMLNCHPDVLCLYEAQLYETMPAARGKQWLGHFPGWREHFGAMATVGDNYRSLQAELDYAVVMDKVPTIDPVLIARICSSVDTVIHITRDLRSWLAKDRIQDLYETRANAVPAAVDYVVALIETHRHPNVVRIRMEDFLSRDSAVPAAVATALGLTVTPAMEAWWDEMEGCHDQDPIKSRARWFRKQHRSSLQAPDRQDTVVSIRPHPVWDALLPIFDRYNTGERRSTGVDDDLATLSALRSEAVPLTELYASIETGRLGTRPKPLRKRLLRIAGKKLLSYSR